MKFKAFTLIELMVTLGVITIIATASVPQVQMWIARNKGIQIVSQVISDFSKAKSIARSIVKQQDAVVAGSFVFGSRPQVSMYFKADSYYILQRNSMTPGGWSETSDTVLKSFRLPSKVELYSVNGSLVTSGITVLFSSSGRLKKDDGSFITPVKDKTYIEDCGSEKSDLKGVGVFMAVFKVDASNNKTLWYRAEISPAGDFFACFSTENSFLENANIIEL